MDDRKVADYFVVAGLPEKLELIDDSVFSESGHLKGSISKAPITDIGVLFPTLGETLPEGFELLEETPSGLPADLNHGSLRSPECYLCFRRGRDRPPLVDIGVMYDGKERLMTDAEMILSTTGGRVANVNNSTARTFITFRRAHAAAPCNALVVTDICIVIASKGEKAPHAFCMLAKNLNKGLVGSDVFLCYKKSMNRPPLLAYKPDVLFRYPTIDRRGMKFPDSVPLFCLPMGATLEMWPNEASQPKPVFSTFVLTVADATDKVYGSAVTFYEGYEHELLDEQQMEELGWRVGVSQATHSLHVNKSICLLSRWPFSDSFERWLLYILDLSTSKQPLGIPIERYITHLLEEVPFPDPRILIQLSPTNASERVILTTRDDQPLVKSGAGFRQLLFSLGSENCLSLLALAITEQKILIHSLRPDTLTAVSEAVSSLLFPFKWQCPYIPLCPLGLAEVLHAPMSYLIGVDSRFFDLYEPPPDVTCVDLDTNTITVCDAQQNISFKLLPKRPARILKNTLDQLYGKIKPGMMGPASWNHRSSEQQNGEATTSLDRDFQRRRKEQELELEIQEAFLRFMATVLMGYRSYLLPITKAPTVGTTDPGALFQMDSFIRSRDKMHHKFYNLVMKTQMFTRFIEERSFASACDGGMDHGLEYFDECTERVGADGEASVRLLDALASSAHNSERTVFVLPPDGPDPNCVYAYPKFDLEPSLMLGSRPRSGSTLGPMLSPCTAAALSLGDAAPDGSPMARRTKQEIAAAQRLARRSSASPECWARCLVGACHSLYFLCLPGHVRLQPGSEQAALRAAYELLVRANKLRLPCDEVCYRVMMQLCGEHSLPVLAVQLLFLMKRGGMQPNALTYGYYNMAVLKAQWPQDMPSGSQLLWNKLRVAVVGAALFRRAGAQREARRNAGATLHPHTISGGGTLPRVRSAAAVGDASDLASLAGLAASEPAASRTSLDSAGNLADGSTAAFDALCRRSGAIVRGQRPARHHAAGILTTAGILISGVPSNPDLTATLDSLSRQRTNSFEHQHSLPTWSRTNAEKRQTHHLTPPESPSECLRVLTRSESFAGDAQILDNLQRIKLSVASGGGSTTTASKPKTCSRTLSFSEEAEQQYMLEHNDQTSPTKSSPLTPVLVDDPLGALQEPDPPAAPPAVPLSIPLQPKHQLSDNPVLFKRSATFGDEPPADEDGSLDRSESVPASTVSSSLASLGNSLKLSFGRYSPARMSLRKATDMTQKMIPTQMIENAITNFSPSSIAGKKSNELLQSGLSSLKSAANSMAKKLDEMKEAMSANSTPVKGALGNSNMMHGEILLEEDSTDGSGSVNMDDWGRGLGRRASSEAELCTREGMRGSCTTLYSHLPDNLYPPLQERIGSECAVRLAMSSCSQCHNCLALLYDEDIMSGWTAEDSNLNTRCVACGRHTVPLLTVHISRPQRPTELISVPYLNPLVLRKELESILSREGDGCLADPKFVESHPIIYWNMVWFMDRANISSHLPELCCPQYQKRFADGEPSLCGDDKTAEGVEVRCHWDEARLHGEAGAALYVLWRASRRARTGLLGALLLSDDTVHAGRSVVQAVLDGLRGNNLSDALRRLAAWRQATCTHNRYHSFYRDILFLSMEALGESNIDLAALQREYARAADARNAHDARPHDAPPGHAAVATRHYFKRLHVATQHY